LLPLRLLATAVKGSSDSLGGGTVAAAGSLKVCPLTAT